MTIKQLLNEMEKDRNNLPVEKFKNTNIGWIEITNTIEIIKRYLNNRDIK
jgi:hypothetical protein